MNTIVGNVFYLLKSISQTKSIHSPEGIQLGVSPSPNVLSKKALFILQKQSNIDTLGKLLQYLSQYIY